MRILAAGDIHGDASLTERLAERALEEDVDLVLLCGDLTDFEKSTENIMGPFKRAGKRVLLVPGNHESIATADFLAEFYDVKNIHGYSVKYEDVGFFGCSGVNIGMNRLSDDEVISLFRQGFDRIRYLKRKVMVSHVHPAGSRMERFSKFVPGSKGVRKAIGLFRPEFMLCSHVHEAEGIEEKIGDTRVINVGSSGRILDI